MSCSLSLILSEFCWRGCLVFSMSDCLVTRCIEVKTLGRGTEETMDACEGVVEAQRSTNKSLSGVASLGL